MLKLNTDEIKNLQFEVVIQGIDYDELTGSLKFMIEDVEYGIPVKIQKDLVSVEVPPLEEIVAKGMKDGDVVECKLDIFGNGFYLNPWDGQFELKTPIKMETTQVKVDNDPRSKTKRIQATLKEEKIEEENEQKTSLDKEAILEMLFERLAEQGFDLKKRKQEQQLESPTKRYPNIKRKPAKAKRKVVVEKKAPKKLTRQQLVERKIKSKFNGIDNLIKKVNRLTESKKVIKNQKSNLLNENISDYDIIKKVNDLKKDKNEQKMNLDPDDPIVLMESLGMRNPVIQQKMINKAEELGGDGNKAVTRTLKRLLGVEQNDPFAQYHKLNKE